MGERVMMDILYMILEAAAGFVFLTIFFAVSWGVILHYKDEQSEWEANRDYKRMQKSIEDGKKNGKESND
jgi:hypothetical protein